LPYNDLAKTNLDFKLRRAVISISVKLQPKKCPDFVDSFVRAKKPDRNAEVNIYVNFAAEIE